MGYGFSCWYIDGKPLPNNYVFTDDVTLTAHYEKNTYKITFITYTEEELEPIEFLYDQKIKLDYKLERDGYKFAKWDILDEYKNMPAYDLVATAIWRSDDGVNYVLNEDKTGYIVYGLYDEEISDLITIFEHMPKGKRFEDLKIVLVDPKRVEFTLYNGLPHMLIPKAITDVDKAISALGWLADEMERRFAVFAEARVRNIQEFNNTNEVISGVEAKIPYIVFIIDELGDLMIENKKDVEEKIILVDTILKKYEILKNSEIDNSTSSNKPIFLSCISSYAAYRFG